ncbi:hypothetical protein [Natronobacterium texcoconense]|uniref:Uncharacterized protein n=1 Tax=Natronobacterium texcoconense TaxID=1095778 RepID=A0A1H1ALA7_NATTX|nr:hypothetical protein [Natronobacterium texcoconense]SDQ40424.1 hypothetical protein SAMN04489842_0731 [Natronobacterium texcoconense]
MAGMPRYLRSIEGSEVAQNDLVAGILTESLEYGPELLNTLHEPELGGKRFSGETELVAAQTKLQSRSERELDWVFEDLNELLVGYESKKKAGFGESQLYQEAVELDRVAKRGARILIVITDDVNEPEIVEETREKLSQESVEVRVEWLSWNDLLARLDEIDTNDIKPQHEPLAKQIRRALEAEGYGSQFTELLHFEEDEIERIQRQQDQIISLIQDLERLAPEIGLSRYSSGRKEIFHWGGRKSLSSLSKSYHPLVPQDIMVPFVPSEYDDFPEERGTSSAYPGVYLNFFEQTVYVGAHLRPNKNEEHREALLNSNQEFAAVAEEHDLTLYSMWNSWGISNTHKDPEEIETVLTEDRLLPDEGYKRLLFGWPLTFEENGQAFVEEILEALGRVHEFSWESNSNLFHPSVASE